MKQYFTPMLLTNLNGSIDITDSQQGAWGGGSSDYTDFNEWYYSADVQANIDMIYPGFSISEESTWPEGFSPLDPTTFYLLFDW